MGESAVTELQKNLGAGEIQPMGTSMTESGYKLKHFFGFCKLFLGNAPQMGRLAGCHLKKSGHDRFPQSLFPHFFRRERTTPTAAGVKNIRTAQTFLTRRAVRRQVDKSLYTPLGKTRWRKAPSECAVVTPRLKDMGNQFPICGLHSPYRSLNWMLIFLLVILN